MRLYLGDKVNNLFPVSHPNRLTNTDKSLLPNRYAPPKPLQGSLRSLGDVTPRNRRFFPAFLFSGLIYDF
jgi:hypothetical protein